MQEPTRQNNILDLVITTEEALLVTLQIKDKIGDHHAIQFLLQTEKEETEVEKTNYNLEGQILKQSWLILMLRDLNASLSIVMLHRDLSSSRTKSLNLVGDISQRNTLPSITRHGSTMMSSSPSQDVIEPMMKEIGTTLMKPVLNTSLLDIWLKEQ